jgi:nickel-dependent lactate racemase
MTIEVLYGDARQSLTLPERNLLGVLKPVESRPFHDTDAALKQAVENCSAFLGDSCRVLVLVNDYTRPTPNADILAALDPALKTKDARFMVCSGTHRPPSPAEYETIFGKDFYSRFRDRVLCHDSRNRSRLFFVGKTSYGTGVWFNKELLWADRVITINSIEPHYFAGFTGGRKGFLPGIAGYDTITQNHNMVTRPGSEIFGLVGNPVNEDMVEAARMVPRPIFSVQVVQDRTHKLLAIRSGDVYASFDAACADARSVFAVPVKEKADIVLSVLRPPYDINFYQSQRAVEFARPALKNPAVQITVSACREGVGNDSFIQVFKGCKSASEILPAEPSSPAPRPSPHSTLGWHKSARLAQIMQTAELYTVMGIEDAVVKSVFMTPFKTCQQALDAALAKIGNDARVYLIPDAGSVVPVLQ